jgi:hypothetical protein
VDATTMTRPVRFPVPRPGDSVTWNWRDPFGAAIVAAGPTPPTATTIKRARDRNNDVRDCIANLRIPAGVIVAI